MRIGGLQLTRVSIAACILLTVTGLVGCGGGQYTSEQKPAPSAAKDVSADRGEEIVAEYLKRDAAPFRKERVRFTVNTDGEAAKIYEFDILRKQADAETVTLAQCVSPAEDKGLGSLTIEAKDKKPVVVTYAISRHDFRETDTNKMFIGGLTAGELLGEWYKFDYKLLGEKEIDGVKAYEVEGKLKPDMSSVASKMTVLFRSDNNFPAEMHLFDVTGREIRTYKILDFKTVGDRYFASKTEVTNPIYKAQIIIEVANREYPTTVDESMFTREKLKQIAEK